MKNISIFQIVVLAVCVLIAIVGIAIFAGFGGSNNVGTPTATVWGTLPAGFITEMVRDINIVSTKINVTYIQKDPATFEAELVNALAEGRGPDIAILDDTNLFAQKNKIQPISFTVFPARDYLDTFIDASSIFVDPTGILAVPLSVDPLVMYWNKNLFAEAGISQPPATWKEFQNLAPLLTKKTDSSTIVQSFAAFGSYSNVTNAKQILATLLFQLGNPITQVNPTTNAIFSVIDQSAEKNTTTKPLDTVVSFYTLFANPSNKAYSWNLSLPQSKQAFLANNLAVYFGHASEFKELQDKNPNLNFDVAEVPQDVGTLPSVYGKISGFAIMRSSRNMEGALAVISTLVSKESIGTWAKLTGLPPVRRDDLALPPTDSFAAIFNRAAVKAKAWYDPNPVQSDAAFRDMIESITTGRKATTGAISDLVGILNRLFGK
jgi:multiple sugar transport system substrate-binding protein